MMALVEPAGGGGGGGEDPRDALIATMLNALVNLAKGRRDAHLQAREKTRLMGKAAQALRAAARSPSPKARRDAAAEIASAFEGEVAAWSVAEHGFREWSVALREVAKNIEGFPLDLLADEEEAAS